MSNVADHPPIDHDDPWTDYRDTLAWYLDIAEDPGKVLKGTPRGATASPRYNQRQARIVFLATLYRLVPSLTDDLLTPEHDALVTASGTARRRWMEESGADLPHFAAGTIDAFKVGPAWEALEEANAAHGAYIDAWQARHHLPDPWFGSVGYWTAAFADGLQRHGLERPQHMPLILPDPDRYINVHDGKEHAETVYYAAELASQGRRVMRWTPPHKWIHVPVYLDDLKHPPFETDDGYELGDEGDFGSWDLRGESIDDAEKRLLEALRPRLRRVLERIEADDRELNEATDPMRTRKTTAFEWLVRYQVLGESRRQISYSLAREKWGQDPDWERLHNPYDNTGYVGREIKRVAELIGLTLRD